jgi:hypothetical protein
MTYELSQVERQTDIITGPYAKHSNTVMTRLDRAISLSGEHDVEHSLRNQTARSSRAMTG